MPEILKVEVTDGKVILDKEEFEQFIEDLESTIETLEILVDKELVKQIAKSEEDVEKGKIYPIKNLKQLKSLLGI